MAVAKKRRTIAEENRRIQNKWEEDYFVVKERDNCICLLCDLVITVMKKNNVCAHYSLKHMDMDVRYPHGTEARSSKLVCLKNARKTATSLFGAVKSVSEKALHASFKVSWQVARAQKPYSLVELIKNCGIIMAKEMAEGPTETKVITKLESIPLSADTATRRVTSCISDINNQLREVLQISEAISLAIDESTDICSVAQLCIFVRSVSSDFDITEELLDIVPLEGQTRGIDIYELTMDTLSKYECPLGKIYSVATDGARSMTGSRIGFTTLLKNNDKTRSDLLSYHCIIHQENLAALHSASLMEVMNDVITIVNYIKSHALNHRQFKAVLKEYDTNYGELVYHTAQWAEVV